ncbi:unnamed protein product [Acanthoscelides obtectus]|uniref:Uncharacterized protein n=1 Tax=Acanthoscelides obtectus TaxID=200917 RepID=A0A9P0KBQ1_ACAOB|nr:unnamed protein product [Acanthoscelides obtectus]CAK1649331.1 hypothetical protein AOBTE_LOCUS16164 [Acanthoscelides obtectus]
MKTVLPNLHLQKYLQEVHLYMRQHCAVGQSMLYHQVMGTMGSKSHISWDKQNFDLEE